MRKIPMSQFITRSATRCLALALLTSTTLSTAFAKSEPLIFQNSIAMTLTQAVSFPALNRSQSAEVNVLPSRGRTWLLEDRHHLRFKFNLQKDRTAPLVFIIPGAGGTSSAPAALALGEKIFSQGYQTVVLDDAFSWTFTVAGSTSALPGYTPDDAVDLYQAMTKVVAALRQRHDVRPRTFSLVGYSLGALESIFLKKLDESKLNFRFSRVVMINPPVDLLYALDGIDALYERGSKLSDERRSWVYGRVLGAGEKYLANGVAIDLSRPDFLTQAFADLGFNDADMVFLIGEAFRNSLRDVILASQLVHDRQILKTPVSRYLRSARNEEAASYSYQDYLKQFLLPSVRERTGENISIAELNRRASLYQFAGYISKQTTLYAIHSEDDFLLKRNDIAWLRRTFGNRLYLFPYGGHLGEMNFPLFTARLKILFPPPP